MSNLFKSKFLMGVLVVAAVVAGVAFANVASADCSITMTLRLGSSGAEVMCLQGKVGAGVDGKFGPMTLNAVKVWQAAHGLVADGVVGPMTRAALMAAPQSPVSGNCQPGWAFNPVTGQACTGTTPPPGSGNNGGLQGGAGDITVDGLSTYASEEVGEGEEDVKVMAFEVEADDNSDVEITSVKVEFFQGTAADSEDFSDYAESVSVWMGSDKVGEADVSDFSENSDVYSKSISLDDAVIEAGDTEKFYVAITAQGTLDSGDIDTDAWYGGVSSIRFLDAEGVTTTESLTLDVDEEIVDDEVEQTFDFADFATATDVELNVSLNSSDDDINEAHVINVDASDDTDDVEVLSFTLENKGDSDINVSEIPVTITTTGETDEAVIVIDAKLWMDGEEIASDDVPTGGAVTFDDLDIDVGAGDEVNLVVSVSLQDVGGALDDGDTVKAEVTSTNVDAIEAEDESGEDLAAADLTGSALGEASAAYDVGFNLDFVSSSETVQTNETTADVGTFVIKYKVTAFDGDVYIDDTCVEDNDGSEVATATSYSVTNNGSNSSTCVVTSTADDAGTAFLVEDGTSETFTLTVSVVPSADSFAQVKLEAIGWGTVTTGDTNVFDFNLPGDFETDPVFLNFTA